MAERAGSSLGYITSKALDGDWSPKEVSMETAAFANRHDVRVGDNRTVFLGRMGCIVVSRLIYQYVGQTLSGDILSLVDMVIILWHQLILDEIYPHHLAQSISQRIVSHRIVSIPDLPSHLLVE